MHTKENYFYIDDHVDDELVVKDDDIYNDFDDDDIDELDFDYT